LPSPLSPSNPVGLRVFSLSNDFVSYPTKSSSLALARHLGVFTFKKPLSYWGNMSTTSLVQKAPRSRDSTLQHLKNPEPFLFTLGFPRASWRLCRLPRKSRSQGLATLSARLSTLDPLEASFSSRRSGASPFRAFLLSSDRKKVSLLLSARALSYQTQRPDIGASAASSHRKSRSPFRSPRV